MNPSLEPAEKTEWGLGRMMFFDACIDLSIGRIPAWKILSVSFLLGFMALLIALLCVSWLPGQ